MGEGGIFRLNRLGGRMRTFKIFHLLFPGMSTVCR